MDPDHFQLLVTSVGVTVFLFGGFTSFMWFLIRSFREQMRLDRDQAARVTERTFAELRQAIDIGRMALEKLRDRLDDLRAPTRSEHDMLVSEVARIALRQVQIGQELADLRNHRILRHGPEDNG